MTMQTICTADKGKRRHVFSDDRIAVLNGVSNVNRFTGLYDMNDTPVSENDQIEIYDEGGDVWLSGVVLYSQQRAMFLLANPQTRECNEKPLGDLLKERTFSIVRGGNKEKKE